MLLLGEYLLLPLDLQLNHYLLLVAICQYEPFLVKQKQTILPTLTHHWPIPTNLLEMPKVAAVDFLLKPELLGAHFVHNPVQDVLSRL